MTSPFIEKLARAARDGYLQEKAARDRTVTADTIWEAVAREVLTAAMEPSEEMLNDETYKLGVGWDDQEAKLVWQAMLTQALKE
jgi:hypothetical protein